MMFRNRQIANSQAGFALPLALTVLLLLSYVIASGLQRVRVAQADIRLAQSNVRADIERQNLEEDIIWRVLLEAKGRETSLAILNEAPRYLARTPRSPWRRDGVPFLWSANYPGLNGDRTPPALVIVQDEIGKIDLNYRNPNYLIFLAARLGIPSGNRREAADILLDYVESKTPRPIDTELRFITPIRTGLQDADELCTLAIWSEIELCRDPERLRTFFVGGLGQSPNLTVASPEVANFLLDGNVPDNLNDRVLAWRAVQEQYGFYNPFEGIGVGEVKMSVTVIPAGATSALRFDIDARRQEDFDPFGVTLRRQVPAEPLLDALAETSPDVVDAFRAITAVPQAE